MLRDSRSANPIQDRSSCLSACLVELHRRGPTSIEVRHPRQAAPVKRASGPPSARRAKAVRDRKQTSP